MSKVRRLLRGRAWLLLAVLLVVGLAATGCVSGLQPVGWSGVVVSGDKLFVGSEEGRLVSVSLSDFSRQWSEQFQAVSSSGGFGCSSSTPAGVAIYGSPAVAGDLVYLTGYDGKIYAFSSSDLQTRWVYPRDGYLKPLVGGPVVAGGSVYFGGSDGKVYALDAATGNPRKEFAAGGEFVTGGEVWATPALADGVLFIGSFDKKFYALNIADGSEKWQQPFETGGGIISTPLVDGNTVYFGSFDRYLYALNTADGSLKWKFPGANWFWAQPLAYNGNIYAGSLDGKVYVLNADTGAEVAEIDLGGPVSSAPVLVGSAIVFTTGEGHVYSVDTQTDRARPLANLGAIVYAPLAASDGTIYLHAQDKTIRRVNADTGAVLPPISLEMAK